MKNINAYDAITFKKTFQTTALYQKIKSDFDILTWSTQDSSFELAEMTPREFRGRRIFSCVPFYYIMKLGTEGYIYDIGCGWNIYKKYLPNIIGISGDPPQSEYYYGDEPGWFDDEFVEQNKERFDNTMTMNALHFVPLGDLARRVEQLLAVTKPNGKIFCMMNVCHLMFHDTTRNNHAARYIRELFDVYEKNILCFELDDSRIDQNMSEGTLRFVMQKHA